MGGSIRTLEDAQLIPHHKDWFVERNDFGLIAFHCRLDSTVRGVTVYFDPAFVDHLVEFRVEDNWESRICSALKARVLLSMSAEEVKAWCLSECGVTTEWEER